MPEPTPLNSPWQQFPTPEILDDLVVEILDSENTAGLYDPLPPGTPHPNQRDYPGYKFVRQQPLSHSRVQRFWSTDYSNQDLYNYDITYVSEHPSYPVFIRRYLIRRDAYATIALQTPLSGLWLITLTNAGSGYDKDNPPTVTISGGAGSGATATALVNSDGTIAWVRVTAEGTGYTSAPTVTIAPPSAGVTATASATIQATTVKLVKQQAEELPSDDPRHSLFLRVTRGYKSLPGPEIKTLRPRIDGSILVQIDQDVAAGTLPTTGSGVVASVSDGIDAAQSHLRSIVLTQSDGSTIIATDAGYVLIDSDPETNALRGMLFRLRAQGATLPAIGTSWGSIGGVNASVISVKEIETGQEGSLQVIQKIVGMVLPDTFVEYPEVAVTFPGVFRFDPWILSGTYDGQYPPPWPGAGPNVEEGEFEAGTYYQLFPRSKKVQGRLTHTYSLGPSGKSTTGYEVYTPGVASRVFRIPNDTVHGEISIFEVTDSGTFHVEDIPPSTPSQYDARQILRFPAGERRIVGNIYERRILEVSEGTVPEKFPDILESRYFQFTTTNALRGQPNPGGERLMLRSTNAGDTMAVTIYGKRDTNTGVRYFEETVTLTGTTPVFTSSTRDWYVVWQVRAASAPAGTITVSSEGAAAQGSATVATVPADGTTITMGLTAGTPKTYTFRSPCRGTVLCPAGSALNTGAVPASYVSFTIAGVQKYFWFFDGSTTDPAPGGTGFSVSFTAGDANTVIAASLRASMVTNLTSTVTSIVSATITFTGIALAAMTMTQDAGNDFTLTTVAAGTADTANQVRTSYDVDGTDATVDDVADWLRFAVNDSGGTEGQQYGTGTTANTDLSASEDAITASKVLLTGRYDYAQTGGWTLSQSASHFTLVAISEGADGPTIAVLTNSLTNAYNTFQTYNGVLILSGMGWTDEQVDVAGGIVKNFPASIGQLTSDALVVPSKHVYLQYIGGGNPPMSISYETWNGAAWVAGTTTLTSMGNRKLYYIELGEATVTQIRLKVTNNKDEMRAMAANLFYSIT